MEELNDLDLIIEHPINEAMPDIHDFLFLPIQEGVEQEKNSNKSMTAFASALGVKYVYNYAKCTPEGKIDIINIGLGVAPQMIVKLPATLEKLKQDGIIKDNQIKLGLYPQAMAEYPLSKNLEELFNHGNLKEGLHCTGRVYPINGAPNLAEFSYRLLPEFEYNGKKYIRLAKDGVGELDNFVWYKVEPITFKILNQPSSLPSNQLLLESDKILIPHLPLSLRTRMMSFSKELEYLQTYEYSLDRAFLNGRDVKYLYHDQVCQLADFRNFGFISTAFDKNRPALNVFKVPSYQKTIYSYAFDGCVGLDEVVVHPEVESISSLAFNNTNFKYAYMVKGSWDLHFSKKLPQLNQDEYEYVNFSNIMKAIPDFKIDSLFALSDKKRAKLNEKSILADKLAANKFSISHYFIDYLVNAPYIFNEFVRDSEFKFVKSEPIINLFNYKDFSKLSERNIKNYYTFLKAIGCFSKDKIIDKNGKDSQVYVAQKAVTFMANLMKYFEEEDRPDFKSFLNTLNLLSIDDKISQDCLKFLSNQDADKNLVNFEMLLNLEKEYSGILVKTITDFDYIKRYRVTVGENGKNIVLPWDKAIIKYYRQIVFTGVSEDNKDIADLFFQNGVLEQDVFASADALRRYAIFTNVPEHILGKPLKEKTILEQVEEIKSQTANMLKEGEKLLDKIYDTEFTYEMLSKRDAVNAIIGLFCDCCASINTGLYGNVIAKNTIKTKDVQNLVVRNGKGEIVAKGTMYVDRKLGYAIFNDFEVKADYRQEKYKEKIFNAFMRGIKDFVKEYDAQNPTRPIQKVNTGIGCNKLADLCRRYKIEENNIESPYFLNFDDTHFEQRILYERDPENSHDINNDLLGE